MSRSSISVIIPAYNRSDLISQTLESLLGQTHLASEIIVVDDGSSDNTARVASSFGPPVRVIRQTNQGPSSARNLGLSEAQGEWVHFFDSDDISLPNLHAEQLIALQRSGADVAYSPWLKCQFSSGTTVSSHHVLQRFGLPREPLVRALLTNWSVVPICSLIRTSLARRVGGFPSQLRFAEDQLFFLRLLLGGARVVHTPSTLVLYRDDNNGKLSSGDENSRLPNLRQWVYFLLLAREECLANGIDPCQWFDYRLRLWDASDSLAAHADPADNPLLDTMRVLQSGPWPTALDPVRRSIRRRGGGLTMRLIGRRTHRSFRAGSLPTATSRDIQKLLIQNR
jgi:glycosyltransferase involved in cell wall biosynthesis